MQNVQRTGRVQQRQGAVAQQDVRARQTGGGSLAGQAREQGAPAEEEVHQGSRERATGGGRFKAFTQHRFFRRSPPGNSAGSAVPAAIAGAEGQNGAAAIGMQPVARLNVSLPVSQAGWLDRELQAGLDSLNSQPSAQNNAPSVSAQPSAQNNAPNVSAQPSAQEVTAPAQPSLPPAQPGNQHTAPASGVATSPVTLRLDSKRQLLVAAPATRNPQSALIRQTLGHAKMHYQSVVASADSQQHTLLDDSGRLLSLHSSPGSLIGLSHSKAEPGWQREETPGTTFPARRPAVVTDHALTLSEHQQKVQIQRNGASSGRPATEIPLPDKGILSQLSGVYQQTTASGTAEFRLHKDKLWQMTSQEEGWKQAEFPLLDKEKDQSKLTRQADNALYLVHDSHHLHNLQTQTQSARFEEKISHFSVAQDGQALLLLTGEESKEQSVKWLAQTDSPAETHRTLNLFPSGTTLASLTQTPRQVIAADHNGRLLVASRPGTQGTALDFGREENQELRNQLHQQIAAVTGDRFHVTDFIQGEGGRLHALVKDGMDRQHAVALNLTPGQPEAASGWNLSDSLVMDFQKGLPSVSPGRMDRVNIGMAGKLALQEGKVHFFNETTLRWEASEVKAERLIAGQDGQAWVLNDNQIKRLKVNLSSNKLNFNQNVFALHQVKKNVSDELALPGLDKNQKTLAAAVLDSGRYLTLQDSGEVHFHQVDSESRRDKKMRHTLSHQALSQAMNRPVNLIDSRQPLLEHKLADIALGPDNQLFLLSDQGKLFSLPQQAWEKGQVSSMREERMPALPVGDEAAFDEPGEAAKPKKLHGNQKGSLLLEMDNGKMLRLNRDSWERLSGDPSPGVSEAESLADQHYDRLSAATRDAKLGKTGLTFKREVNTFGQSGHDGHKVHTPFRTRLSTFVFRPTMATPRPLKNMGHLIQHAHGGRQGLSVIYQQQQQQMRDLNQHLQQLQRLKAPGALRPEEPLSLKLKTLAAKPDLPDWFGEMQKFNATLADSAAHQARLLQQHYGKPSGGVKEQLASVTGRMNPASTQREDLTTKLTQLFSLQPSGKGNLAQLALSSLQSEGVQLSHQKPTDEIPLGLHRDKHDTMGLIKSRLILDGLTNAKLHDLTGRLATAMALQGETREKALNALGREFRELRESEWEGNPLKQVTSQGFTGNDKLESNYDAIKSMTKAFTKENHAMNVTTRTVMQAEDQQTLARRMEGTVLSMEKGESISFSRAYGAATTITGVPGTQVIAGVGGRGNIDRGYNMSLTRGEGGVTVSFGRDGGGGVTAFSGFGYNLLTDFMKDSAHTVPIDHERNLAPAVRLGGVISATPLDVKKQNSISFDITEAELPAFIQGLTEGTLDPLTLMNRGINHSVKHGDVMNVSLDANAAALASAGIPLTSKHEKETPASFRVGGGAYAGVNVLSGTRERGTTSKEESSTFSRSNNRPRGLNKASVGANFALPLGVLVRGDDGRLPLFAGPAASVQLSIDNRTKQSLSLETKNARPLEPVHIDKLMETLGKSFSDPASAGLLEKLKDKSDDEQAIPLTPRQKLDRLVAHFAPRDRTTLNNGQQAVLRDLDKHLRQQKAAEQGKRLLQNGEYQTTYANLSKVNSNGLWHQLSHLLDGQLNASNATKIRELMSSDHQLQSLIATLQDNVSTDATVTLELKDEVREQLEERWLEQGNSPEEMMAELINRDNLRLKSIAFTKSQIKTDGFATPAFLLGGSNNASVSMKRNLGKITFSYGENQNTPTQYALDGRIAKATSELAAALQQGQENDFVLKG
ncbi:AvrE-family type 3 secretion system effector [Erwinia sp. P7711]|uniref:AvrE-family type 3 secretion system effector n=1 Tax=Erwinia sp. P7711 TaxID=3141451 RepID=UPI00319D1CB4